MKRAVLYILFLSYSLAALAGDKKPDLVVGIVVDQMRWDYLYRYYDEYGDGGFRRLMDNGFNCQQTMVPYVPTYTGPGHTCIYTGSVPAIHGIVANDWLESSVNKMLYCVEDERFETIGGSYASGKMSPANMFANTVTDELRLSTHGKSKVYGIGIKDRGSILPAGHSANGAFWFDDSTGSFITSSYYMNKLPGWLTKFNNRRWADTFMAMDWSLLYPTNVYQNSTSDITPWEGKLPGEESPVFPHKVPHVKGRGYYGLRYMPWGNTLTLKLARSCIKGAQLGSSEFTDFLCITLSTTDYAGHNYGPDALEMEDMYLRLDNELASFLAYLDSKVGKGNYTVFLTADHGAAHNADFMNSMRIPAGSHTQAESVEQLNSFLKSKTGKDSLVRTLYNYQVYLNEERIAAEKADRSKLKGLIADWLYQQDGVANVIDLEGMDDAVVPEPVREMVINGYYRPRSGEMQIILKPGWYSGHSNTGTTHGSWNPYDAHIPLLWYGWGIKKGETYRTVNMTDIAPTISALLHIQMPNGCVGKVITEILEK